MKAKLLCLVEELGLTVIPEKEDNKILMRGNPTTFTKFSVQQDVLEF